jgi:RNA polymerase sigma factor (sigma-70 family)
VAAASASERGPAWPEGEAIANQATARVDRIVAALPLKQRLAFTLRKVHELEYEAIAESLQCSAESARAHVFQALKKIRLALEGHAVLAKEASR